MQFKKWLLKEDIFGFERQKEINVKSTKLKEPDNLPIVSIDIEITMDKLLQNKLNSQIPFSNFINEIQWGKENGAIKMVISPLGSFKSIIRQLSTDLLGNKTWICKKILPYKDLNKANVKIDEKLADLIFEDVEKISKKNVESPLNDYKNFRNLVLQISQECQKSKILPSLLIFMGIKELKKNENYILHFECKGQGVEAPTSARVEAFLIDMIYDPKTGIIRSIGYEVQSPTKGRKWIPQPSEWDEYFSPAQPNSEIIECVSRALYTYA